VTPMKGTIWGWLKCFHITASLQNNCKIGSSTRIEPEVEVATCLFNFIHVVGGAYPDLFDTDVYASIERPFVRVTESAKCNRHFACKRKNPGHLIGSRKGRPTAAYLPQHLEALPERLTPTIELAKDLCVLLSVTIR